MEKCSLSGAGHPPQGGGRRFLAGKAGRVTLQSRAWSLYCAPTGGSGRISRFPAPICPDRGGEIVMWITPAYAQGATGGGSDMLIQLLPFVAIFVIMYFLILRP